ncbi:helix-turn-helix transcriptional regulator [Luteimonas pelagia]
MQSANPAASAQRIRQARRHAGLSQAQLAAEVGVHRSAVSHWETPDGRQPSAANLRGVVLATGVAFEWLATGRGEMLPSAETLMASVAAVDAELVDDPRERRLLDAFRHMPVRARVPLLELAEQLAAQRRPRRLVPPGDA